MASAHVCTSSNNGIHILDISHVLSSSALRFITRPELAKLGLDHLMGTSLLRAYMHGFFVDNRLYNKARAMMDPFAYETYRAQRIAKKVEDERAVRISIVKKLPKVGATGLYAA